jgi:thioredoxin-related protein
MKRFPHQYGILLVLLLTCFAGAAEAAVGRDPYKYFFNETWGDFSEELEKARAEGKKGILIFFELDECPFCHRMKRTVLNQPEVQAFFREQFLCFSIDIEGDVEMTNFHGEITTQKDFAFKTNRVRATPVFAFYDLEGNRMVRYTGATSGIEEFMWLGEYVAKGLYKEMRFTTYKRQKKKAARQAN